MMTPAYLWRTGLAPENLAVQRKNKLLLQMCSQVNAIRQGSKM